METSISIRGLKKIYVVGSEHVRALDGINLNIPKGEMISIFGASGSGKSTLLNQMAGFEKPTAGSVTISGVTISSLSEREMASFRREHIGFIFQSYDLIPYMTALENVALPLIFKGTDKQVREKRAKALLKRVGLEDRMNHFPTEMSGGQQQRVGIARAFAAGAEVILADEPTGNLDSVTTEDVMDMIGDLSRRTNKTVVLVTHNPSLAKRCDRIITLKDGKIINIKAGKTNTAKAEDNN